ncbi:hypothetical protein V8B55DRAFT_1479971 [Mucor lusitanicus]|uniref:Uncharacterized protein n=1 Tax=Mucor circinelloides f. lusitanicus TaxID=29924 RepID=A0A8H4BHT5_MUCCL|nr:hypothetical protein FB192DRAFT_1378056 [Mucor lusitanicus]
MKLLSFLLFTIFSFVVCSASDSNAVMSCIKQRAASSLSGFDSCFNTTKGTTITKIKRCLQEDFIAKGIFKRQANGQFLVDKEAFDRFGSTHSSTVAKAVYKCTQGRKADDKMFKETVFA